MRYPPPPTRFGTPPAASAGARASARSAAQPSRTPASPAAPPAPRPARVAAPPTRFDPVSAGASLQRKPVAAPIPASHRLAPGVAQPAFLFHWIGSLFAADAPAPMGAAAGAGAAVPAGPSPAERARLAAEANRQKQLAETRRKKEEAKKQAEEEAQRKAEQAAKRQAELEQQREEEIANARANETARAQREAADQARRTEIDAAAAEFVTNGLNAQRANDIATDAKDRSHGEARARTALQAALNRQLDPPLDRWRFKLGMNQEPANYALRHANAAAQAFPQYGGQPVHITFDKNSIAAAPGSITGHTAAALVQTILSSPARPYRIHATQENQEPANHYFYGDVAAADRPDKQHLQAVLDAFITSDILPRVQDAIDRHGDI